MLPATEPVEVWGNQYTRILEIDGSPDGIDMESMANAISWVESEILATPARLSEVMGKWSFYLRDDDPTTPVAVLKCTWTPQRTV